jgi:hypothetical protein
LQLLDFIRKFIDYTQQFARSFFAEVQPQRFACVLTEEFFGIAHDISLGFWKAWSGSVG